MDRFSALKMFIGFVLGFMAGGIYILVFHPVYGFPTAIGCC